MTTCKARIKYAVLLNVLFYKWLGYPAGISGWHCAAVTTTISPTHACLSMGASPQKSNVRCYPSSHIEKNPAQHWGARRPCFLAVDGKTPLLSLFCFWAWWLSWLHCDDHNTHPLFILYLTEARSNANYDSVFDCKAKFGFHIYQREFTGNIYPIYPKDYSSSRCYTCSFLNYA